MKKTNKETEELIKALKLDNDYGDTPTKEWVSLAELSKNTNVSRNYLAKKLAESINKGEIERKMFRIKLNGCFRVVPYYKKKRSSDSVASKSGN